MAGRGRVPAGAAPLVRIGDGVLLWGVAALATGRDFPAEVVLRLGGVSKEKSGGMVNPRWPGELCLDDGAELYPLDLIRPVDLGEAAETPEPTRLGVLALNFKLCWDLALVFSM